MTHPTATSNQGRANRLGSHLLAIALATLGLLTLGLLCVLGVGTASAAVKKPVDFFGGYGSRGGQFGQIGAFSPVGIAVNETGAGAADQGDVYVVDTADNRIQRFARDDHGTSSEGADDTYSFISAWGAGVDSSTATSGYEVCTVAEDCREGNANGSNGALAAPTGIAVDGDTGEVYVVDRDNNRINVYTADGAFLRSFGFDVVETGPDDAGAGYEVCVAANGDVCKAGIAGAGVGQVGQFHPGSHPDLGIAVSQPDGNASSGSIFLADRVNHRIDTYRLDGSSPAAIGSAAIFTLDSPGSVAVDSRGIVYASSYKNDGEIERYDSENANGGGVGFLAPISSGINEVQFVWVSATAGTFNLTYQGETTVDLPFDAPANDLEVRANTPGVIDTVEEALNALPAIGEGGVQVAGGSESEPYRVKFNAGLGNPDVEQISAASGAIPLSGDRPLVGTAIDGGSEELGVGANEQQQVSVNASAGQFGLTFIAGTGREMTVPNGNTIGVKVDRGTFRVGDTFECGSAFPPGTTITAIDAEGTLSILTLSQSAIPGPGHNCGNVSATETTADIAWNAPPSGPGSVQAALTALPGIGAGNIAVTGGPGNSTGSNPYQVTFTGALGGEGQLTMTPSNGTTPLSGGTGASATTLSPGQAGLVAKKTTEGLAVVPDSDGGGPATDTLYTLRAGGTSVIQQFGPTNPPGLTAPPVGYDDIHVTQSATVDANSGQTALGGFDPTGNFAIDAPSGRIYLPAREGEGGLGVYVLGEPGPGPSATFDSLSDLSATTVTAHATITPNGPPALSYHFEYSTDGVKWISAPSFVLGSQKTPQSVSFTLNPGGGGLDPDTLYHIRLVAKRPFFPAIVSAEKTFTTLAAPPLAETLGSLLRTTTGVRLDGRVAPRNAATTYRFEYGEQGPCDSNPCTATEAHPAGSGVAFELVSQQVEGLQPNTTYHYRVIAENANPGSPAVGEDMTVTTRGEEAPLTHGHLPGPPGSDRAWELVSAPDTGGNPVGGIGPPTTSISDDGDRAVYQVAGGTPDSVAGNLITQLFAERTPSGWQTKRIFPRREDAKGTKWGDPSGPSDLSSIVVANHVGGRYGEVSFWRLSPNNPPQKLYTNPDLSVLAGIGNFLATSDDGSRTLATLIKTQDPAHPVQGQNVGLYDFKEGSAQLISLLPDGSVPPCGVAQGNNEAGGLPTSAERSLHIISADGSLAFFPTKECAGAAERLYVRDIPAETTRLISTPPISGRECDAHFIKSIPGAVFFYSQSRLVAEDVEPESCNATGDGSARGGDVYRYDLGDGALDCLTCVGPGVDGEVALHTVPYAIHEQIGVAEDGSRLYFTSGRRLLPGAPATGGIYRLAISSGDLAYVGAFGFIGDAGGESFMNPDGSVVVFEAKDPSVNALGGQQNGATKQFYRYDDRDRSLLCISCPDDGSAASVAAGGYTQLAPSEPGANLAPLSRDGEDFAFLTTRPLVPADQNTARAGQDPKAGSDVYEWRAGRLLLVSDGLKDWPGGSVPGLGGITPSGHDIFFTAPAQYTQDALDGYNRLYDARIGGGFEFPQPPKPCPLEVCQGTPKGAPEEQAPGTATIAGAGNVSRAGRVSCAKPKRKVRKGGKTRCVKPARNRHAHRRANNNRRTAR